MGINQERRTGWQLNCHPPQAVTSLMSVVESCVELRRYTVNDENVIEKIKDFHRKLFTVEAKLCLVCLERFRNSGEPHKAKRLSSYLASDRKG